MPPAPPTRWPLLLALALAGCPRSAPTPTAPDGVTTSASEPTTGSTEPAEGTPAADPTHPLEIVPARARMMLMARSPQRLLQAWERERIAGSHPAGYARIVDGMKQNLGYDLLDPSALVELGIDPTAPVGVAVLSVEDEAVVLFGGTTDPQRMIDWVRRFATKHTGPLEPRTVGQAQLLRLADELTLVLRNDMFAWVLVDRPRQGTPDYAQEIARIDPARSLAHAHAMQQAHAGLPHEADVQGLLDVAGLLHDAFERSRQREQAMVADASRRLAEARQRGASAEELDGLQRSLQDQQAFAASMRRERQIGELLLSRTFGAIEGIGLAADADAHGLRGRVHVALSPDAVFRELFVSSDQPPAAVAALADAPQLVLSGQADVRVALDLFAQAALATGTSYAEINDGLRGELHMDFDRELRPLLDGRGTFVITAGPPLDPTRASEFEETFGGLLALGVTDEAKARAVLDQMVSRWPEPRWEPAPEIGGHVFRRPRWPHALWMGVVGGQLAVSSDLATLRRLRDGQAGPASAHFPDPEPWQRLTEGPGAMRLALHHRLPLSALFALFSGFSGFDFPLPVDDLLRGEFIDEDLSSIPLSPATRRLEQKRERAWEAKREVLGRRDRERQVMAWNAAAALGITAGVVRRTDTGLMFEGGHYVEGGMGHHVEAVLALLELEDTGQTSVDAELARAIERQEAAEKRLLDARRKEVRRALAQRR